MSDQTYNLVLYGILGLAGLAAGLVLVLVPTFVRLAVRVKGVVSMVPPRTGKAIVYCASASVVLIFARLTFALAHSTDVPLVGLTFYGVAFLLMDVAMVLLGSVIAQLYRKHPELAAI